MGTILKSISDWYDTLVEPYRFIVFLFMVFGSGVFFLSAAIATTFTLMMAFMVAGGVQWFLLISLAVYRAVTKAK